MAASATLRERSDRRTFKRRLEDRCGFEGQEQLFRVLAERPALLGGHDELADETGAVADVVVLIVLGQVQNVLRQQFGLRREGTKMAFLFLDDFIGIRKESVMSEASLNAEFGA